MQNIQETNEKITQEMIDFMKNSLSKEKEYDNDGFLCHFLCDYLDMQENSYGNNYLIAEQLLHPYLNKATFIVCSETAANGGRFNSNKDRMIFLEWLEKEIQA